MATNQRGDAVTKKTPAASTRGFTATKIETKRRLVRAGEVARVLDVALFVRTKPDGTSCFAGRRRINRETRLDISTIKRHLGLAERRGWLRAIRPGPRRSTEYRPSFPLCATASDITQNVAGCKVPPAQTHDIGGTP